MKMSRIGDHVAWLGLFLMLATLLALPRTSSAATEDRFDVLQIGTHTYQNVTVTTKAKNYIFILHSTGMSNLKVAELPPELLEKLGYTAALAPKVQTNIAAVWAKQAVAKMETPQVKQMQTRVVQAWRGALQSTLSRMPSVTPRLILAALAVLLLVYLFHCYCCMLICQKTGKEPGVLVWFPVLQLFPLLRAASMSGWWVVAFFIPVLNLVGHVLWCVKIVQARSKTMPLMILLLLPVTSLFAFLYLAFSDAVPQKKEERRVEIMTLETA